MTKQQLIKEFREKFKCIQRDCDGNGNIPHQVGEGEWEAEQCQFHAEYLFPLEAFLLSAFDAGEKNGIAIGRASGIEEAGKRLIEQIKVAILAQETGINAQAQLLGLDKWLGGYGTTQTKYQQDKLQGQRDLLRWIEKGYFPALTPSSSKDN